MRYKRCGIAVLILLLGCAPVVNKTDTPIETPWITPTTQIRVWHFGVREKGDRARILSHIFLPRGVEPWGWAAVYWPAQYVLNFQVMTGTFIPSLPCTLIVEDTGGEL